MQLHQNIFIVVTVCFVILIIYLILQLMERIKIQKMVRKSSGIPYNLLFLTFLQDLSPSSLVLQAGP